MYIYIFFHEKVADSVQIALPYIDLYNAVITDNNASTKCKMVTQDENSK